MHETFITCGCALLVRLRMRNASSLLQAPHDSSSSISSTVADRLSTDPLTPPLTSTAELFASTLSASASPSVVPSAGVDVPPTFDLADLEREDLEEPSFLTRRFFLGSSYAQTGTNESNWGKRWSLEGKGVRR